MNATYRAAKRFIDLALSSAGLLASWPVIIAAGLAVKLDSPGPVFYRSRRVGRHGKPFDLLKLRTMRVDQDPNAPLVTAGGDSRITRVGRWLRRTKLDELPQLINVLKGDVSLIGPRPEVERYVACYPAEYSEILEVRPGLADQATLRFIDEESILAEVEDPERHYIEEVLPKKIDLYLEYVRRPSLRADLSIIVETALHVARRTAREILC